MTGKSPLPTLASGVQRPALGLGVLQSVPEQSASAIDAAIADGYRLIDTATAGVNERQVGEGITRRGSDHTEMFVTAKRWISDYGSEHARHAFEASHHRLGLDSVDRYLLHWPVASDFEATVTSYRAAEKQLAKGRVRTIGVCHFSPDQLKKLLVQTDVV